MFKDLGDFLERPAGHVMIFLGVIALGIGVKNAASEEHGNELITVGITGIVYAMKPGKA